VALKLAIADVILPDEIFANEAGRMSCDCSGRLSQSLEDHLQPGRHCPVLSLEELDRFAERVSSDRPESKTRRLARSSQGSGVPGGAPS